MPSIRAAAPARLLRDVHRPEVPQVSVRTLQDGWNTCALAETQTLEGHLSEGVAERWRNVAQLRRGPAAKSRVMRVLRRALKGAQTSRARPRRAPAGERVPAHARIESGAGRRARAQCMDLDRFVFRQRIDRVPDLHGQPTGAERYSVDQGDPALRHEARWKLRGRSARAASREGRGFRSRDSPPAAPRRR
jgi:hypothetical protein